MLRRTHARRVGARIAWLAAVASAMVGLSVAPAGAAQDSTHTAAAKPAATGDAALIEQLMAAGGGRTRISAEPATGVASFIGFPADSPLLLAGATTPPKAASRFLGRYGTLFGIAPHDLALSASKRLPDDGWVLRYSQRHGSIPVAYAGLVVRLDTRSRILSVTGKVVPSIGVGRTPKVAEGAAVSGALRSAARHWRSGAGELTADGAQPMVYDPALVGRSERTAPRLTWRVRVAGAVSGENRVADVFVDASTGRTVGTVALTQSALDRSICNNANDRNAPSVCSAPVRVEGGAPSGDTQVDAAYDFLGDVYGFYQSRFGRDSINGAGQPLNAVARFCVPDLTKDCPLPNASWDGATGTMVFGDGFVTDDVTAHEMTHGVTESMNGLVYLDQSGAINESMSDIFGEFVDLTNAAGDDSARLRWKIGEDLPGGAIRDMSNPTLFGDPNSTASPNYRLYPAATECVEGNDFCGVHSNSGVGNHAAALMTDGGTFGGRTVLGLGIDKAARVYYEAEGLLTSSSRYRDLADALVQGCTNLVLGAVTTVDDCAQVENAVDAVRMRQAPAQGGTAISTDTNCSNQVLPRNDDGSSVAVTLPFPINFFGNTHTTAYVNNNGNVTFDGPLSTFTPFGLTTNISTPIIAPFFADIDTRGVRSDEVTYGTTADGRTFCVNWAGTGVGYFSSHDDKWVRAQLLLVDRSGDPGAAPGDFDIVMNYGTINWETGDASGGTGGFGGTSARAGYSAGTGLPGTFFEFSGSGVNGAFLDSDAAGLIHSSRNSTQLGRYVFPVRAGAAPVGGGVSGTVFEGSAAAGNEVAGAFVQVCPADPLVVQGCSTSSTTTAGAYRVSGLSDGPYRVTAYPPGASRARPVSRDVTIAGGSSADGQDLVLDVPLAPPVGTTVTDLYVNADGVPVVYWATPLALRTTGCVGAAATYSLQQNGLVLRSGPMTETPDGVYSALIAPLQPATGYARISIELVCPDGTTQRTVFDLYIDPSGIVVDTAGAAVEGATVTLYRADDFAGPFTVVPDGSGLMSVANRRNPMTTGADGHFGWDVVAGFYKVRAERTGCTSPTDPGVLFTETATLTIPPPVTDLRLVLDCGNHPPTAPDRDVTTPEDTAVTVDTLTGTTDPEGDPVGLDSAAPALHGTVTCTAAGLCSYTPAADYFGADSFTYTVSDGRGGTATATVAITVTPVNDLPAAAFTATPSTGQAPLDVTFDATSSIDVEGITGYAWTFGDGGTGTGVTTTHRYPSAGTYTVVLTVTDGGGATSTASSTIVVTPAPVPPTPRDALAMERTGAQQYRFGGTLTAGDFVLARDARGRLKGLSGTGSLEGRRVSFSLLVRNGRASGSIVVRDAATGRVLDSIPVRGTPVTLSGNTVSGQTVWGRNARRMNRLVWAITDAVA